MAAIGLGLDAIKELPDSSSAWNERIRHSGYCFNLQLARPDAHTSYKSLDFISSQPVDWVDLEGTFAETIAHKIENKPDSLIPVVFITRDLSSSIVDLTMVTYSFDIGGLVHYGSNTTVEDVGCKLRSQISRKVNF
jgi:hypothetical protein